MDKMHYYHSIGFIGFGFRVVRVLRIQGMGCSCCRVCEDHL